MISIGRLVSAALLAATIAAQPVANLRTAARQTCPISSVCFAIDRSGSISAAEYAVAQQFVVGIAREIALRAQNAQYSAYGFESSSVPIQRGTRNLTAFIRAVRAPVATGGGTNIAAGLAACRSEILADSGDRVIVLITDGQGDDNGVADAIDAAGIALVTVGVGNGIDTDFLRAIATRPRFFISSTFDALPSDVARVAVSSCRVTDVMPARPTLAPPTSPPAPAPAPMRSSCQRAFDRCTFRFEGSRSLPTFNVGGRADVSFTSRIVSKRSNVRVGVANTNDVTAEFVQSSGAARAITMFGSPRLTMSHFKPFYIMPAAMGMAGGSGIGHQTFEGNQLSVSRRRCVRVFFTRFQLLSRRGDVISNERAGRPTNCVVFRTM